MFGLKNKDRLKTIDWFLLYQLDLCQKAIIEVYITHHCELRVSFDSV